MIFLTSLKKISLPTLKQYTRSSLHIRHSSHVTSGVFLHESSLRTDHYQAGLPRLPVPRLEDTCHRYLRAITPLFPQEQLENTKKIVADFLDGEGAKLQKELLEYDQSNPDKSYISDPWSDMYLNAREPIPLNFSPSLQYIDDPRPGYMDQAIRSTNFIVSTVKFMKTMEAEILHPYVLPTKPNAANAGIIKSVPVQNKGEPEKTIPALPVCMSQFKYLFKSTRLPGQGRDSLQTYPNSRHVVAMRKGHFYTIDILDEHDELVPPAQILSDIRAILNAPHPPASHPLGILTTENRDIWAQARKEIELAGNKDSLHQIDSGIFTLILDDEAFEDSPELTRNFLHGTGTNRWFDTSFQLLVTSNGKMGKIMEHSWGDGVTSLYYAAEAFKDMTTQPAVGPDTEGMEGRLQKIEFAIPESAQVQIEEAKQKYDALVGDLQILHASCDLFGSKLAKSAKLSPDAMAQLGYQMAFHKLHGYTAPTYESCSTSIFKLGRTETIRSATMATRQFSEMMQAKVQPSKQELRMALAECSKMHTQLAGEAAMGQGHDRHLYGLRSLVQRQGGSMPAIFTDPSYAQSCMFRLSTSTIGAPKFVYLGAFGPVVADGYGIMYAVRENKMAASVSSYSANDCALFRDTIEESWAQIYQVLQD